MKEKNYSIPEVAQELRVSSQWVSQRIKAKEIRYLRIGRRIFIPESALNEYLEDSIVEVEGK